VKTAILTCPRCFVAIDPAADARFCPHCGLADVKAAALDTAPVDVTVGRCTYRINDRIAVGAICMIYRCRFRGESGEAEGVFKIARDGRTNDLVTNEADVLQSLHSVEDKERLRPFIPALKASFTHGSGHELPRQANILRLHEEIRSVDELYSLAEVKAHYAAGLEARDMAWIWRRLLTVLGYIHNNDIVHCAVLPMHILIDPRDHKLVLIDWCSAVQQVRSEPGAVVVLDHSYEPWYRRQLGGRKVPSKSLDVGLAARCMVDLMGGDGLEVKLPPAVEPALGRYFQRCIVDAPSAWTMLQDFDHLIEALWGPRRFRTFAMPPKGGIHG
jgi:hypothetical protein